MSFKVEVLTGMVQVEPGSTAPAEFTITNETDEAVEFEVVLEGLDGDWAAVPVPVFVLAPRASQTERYFLKPPRTPESSAATYPYAVTVRSLETGETKKVPAVLDVRSFHHLTVDFNPRRVSVAYNRGAMLEVVVANLGNCEHRVQLFAADQDNLFAFEFEAEEAVLAPGQQKTVPLILSATQPSLLSNPRLAQFSVSARSADYPSVAGSAQGQAEQKAMLSPGSVFIGVFLLLVAALWWVFLPKPPRIDAFTVSQEKVIVGEPVVLSWSSQDASYVRLKVGTEDAVRMPRDGQHTFTPDKEGQVDVQAVAIKDGQESAVSYLKVDVSPVPKAPPPTITSFEVEPRKIRKGDSVLVKYTLGPSVTQATLEPFTTTLDPKSTSFQVTPTMVGSTTIKLIARNSDGASIEKSITVSVTNESLATIEKFTVDPKVVDPEVGQSVKVTWQVTNAVRAEIKVGDLISAVSAASGVQEFVISKDTVIEVSAWDSENRVVTKSAKVTIKKPPVAPDPGPPTVADPDAPSTTGGGAGPTSGGTTGP